jgi:hypothetical protein
MSDVPRIVPELSSVATMSVLAYLRHPQRPVLARLGLGSVFALGSTLIVFPKVRSRLSKNLYDSLPADVQSGLESFISRYENCIVVPLVDVWNSTEKGLYLIKETLFK